ncbi:MAG: DUF58 domain-containing protein [Planctomycetales bacterium]|nr:DUF58 domain-containing protein [Planctomycetales bacterium]
MSLDLSSESLSTVESLESAQVTGGSNSRQYSTGPKDRSVSSDRPRAWKRTIVATLRFVVQILAAPFRGYQSLRRSVTVASISVLLALFMTLNVIWGFPWSGMMGAGIAMLLVGSAINRMMGPRLKFSVSLPRTAVVGHPFSVNVRLTNERFLPALNLRVGWDREGVRDIFAQNNQVNWDASPPVDVDILRSGDQMQWHGSMRFDKRGIHDLPPFQVASTFPFHFFHNRKQIDPATKIAITPAPATSDEDPTTRLMLASIGEWAKLLIKGAPVEYVGNREYQVGVPVRRWDFASWARLGRPIVREYQAPSIQAVTLIVDTSQESIDDKSLPRSVAIQRRRDSDEEFERLMSIATSAIAEISSRRVQLRLVITCESDAELSGIQFASLPEQDNSRMLVRLAAAHGVDPVLGVERIRKALQTNRAQPTIIFSLCDLDRGPHVKLAADLPANATYFPILPRSQHESPQRTGEAL